MKIKFYLFVTIIGLTFASCNKDDANELVGTWNLTDVNYTGKSDVFFNGVKDYSLTYVGKLKDNNGTSISFNESPQTYTAVGSYTVELISTFEDGAVSADIIPIDDFADTGTWSLKDNKLTTTSTNGEVSVTDVTFIDDNNFKVTTSVSEEEIIDSEFTVKTSTNATINYKRK